MTPFSATCRASYIVLTKNKAVKVTTHTLMNNCHSVDPWTSTISWCTIRKAMICGQRENPTVHKSSIQPSDDSVDQRGQWLKVLRQIKLPLANWSRFISTSADLCFRVQGGEQKYRVNHWLHKVGTAAYSDEWIWSPAHIHEGKQPKHELIVCLRWLVLFGGALTCITCDLKHSCTIFKKCKQILIFLWRAYFLDINWAKRISTDRRVKSYQTLLHVNNVTAAPTSCITRS